jgi:release factor H-coupled RctB family protein
MTNDDQHTASQAKSPSAEIRRFYSDRAWIEGAAERQLEEVASLDGMESVCAFPDVHPSKNGPVGIAAAATRLYPHLVGNDIGCGFDFFELDLEVRKLRLDKAEARLRSLDFAQSSGNGERLEAVGLDPCMHAGSLGTIGGGNHFAELQSVSETLAGFANANLSRDKVYLLVHSGSRSYGAEVWDTFQARAGDIHAGFDPGSGLGSDWLAAHDLGVTWATLNRAMIAERIADALRCGLSRVCGSPHNLVVRAGARFVHYKGATSVRSGEIAPVAGSRDSLSHIVMAEGGVEGANNGIAHGSGRKYDRNSMHHREGLNRSGREALKTNRFGGTVLCDDPALLVEEAASAYKNPAHVVADLEAFGLVRPVCSMAPLMTYKKVVDEAKRAERGRRTFERGGKRR